MNSQVRNRAVGIALVAALMAGPVLWVTFGPQANAAGGADRSVPLAVDAGETKESVDARSRSVAIDVNNSDFVKAHDQMTDAQKGLKDTSCPGGKECESGGPGERELRPSPAFSN